MRAAVTGSAGDANGSLSMMTQLSASPITSTPCQKLDVANSTACGVARNWLSSCDRGVLVVLDPRLKTKGYGRRFVASLPPAPVVHDLSDVDAFFSR